MGGKPVATSPSPAFAYPGIKISPAKHQPASLMLERDAALADEAIDAVAGATDVLCGFGYTKPRASLHSTEPSHHGVHDGVYSLIGQQHSGTGLDLHDASPRSEGGAAARAERDAHDVELISRTLSRTRSDVWRAVPHSVPWITHARGYDGRPHVGCMRISRRR